MMKPAVAALALLLSSTAPVFAQDGTTPSAVETPAVETPAAAPPKALRAGDIAPDGTKVKCRKVEVIGTRFPKRECKSEGAWKQFDAMMKTNAKDAADRLQRNNTSGATN